MKRICVLMGLLCALVATLSPVALGQAENSTQITSELIGPLNGNITINRPPTPNCPADSDGVSVRGNIHVLAIVNTSTNTMDVHVNLLNVKGKGELGKYVGVGAMSFPGIQRPPSPNYLSFTANLFPPDPCREGYNGTGALGIRLTLNFDETASLSSVSASAFTPDVNPN